MTSTQKATTPTLKNCTRGTELKAALLFQRLHRGAQTRAILRWRQQKEEQKLKTGADAATAEAVGMCMCVHARVLMALEFPGFEKVCSPSHCLHSRKNTQTHALGHQKSQQNRLS